MGRDPTAGSTGAGWAPTFRRSGPTPLASAEATAGRRLGRKSMQIADALSSPAGCSARPAAGGSPVVRLQDVERLVEAFRATGRAPSASAVSTRVTKRSPIWRSPTRSSRSCRTCSRCSTRCWCRRWSALGRGCGEGRGRSPGAGRCEFRSACAYLTEKDQAQRADREELAVALAAGTVSPIIDLALFRTVRNGRRCMPGSQSVLNTTIRTPRPRS